MGRFQLELIYLYFPPSFHQTVVVTGLVGVDNVITTKGLQEGNNNCLMVENKGKLIRG